MVSPWPPSTKAVTFSTETLSSWAMKVRKRAESSTPAMPITRWGGKPDFFQASCTMASSGLVTRIRMALFERATTCSTTPPTISAFLNRRSSRVMPGLRQVERLALGNAFDDIHEHHVAQLALDGVLRDRGADVAGAHHGDLRAGHDRSPLALRAPSCCR